MYEDVLDEAQNPVGHVCDPFSYRNTLDNGLCYDDATIHIINENPGKL